MEAVPGQTYDDAPRIVIWELTRACALACRHCRAEAIPHRDPRELSTAEARALIDAVAECGRPLFVLTGGDPLMRDDLYEIVEYGVSAGLRLAVSPSATGRLTRRALERLAAAGCSRISLSIDAPDAQSHDAFRGVKGSFGRTLDGLRHAREFGIEVQINTTISRFNHTRIAEMAEFLTPLQIALWSVFFLVPVGRGQATECLDAHETEAAFAALYAAMKYLPCPVKTTEAPHFRRFVAQRQAQPSPRGGGIGDGRGFVFISHIGEVHPSGFLPYVVGNVRESRLIDLYRDDPIMQSLRRPDGFGGKCGSCDYRYLCGGSRARAFAYTGDLLAQEPSCLYQAPKTSCEVTHA
ncbi:MAG: radical SAM protein [Vulcanimicrobiaceae bacterium]